MTSGTALHTNVVFLHTNIVFFFFAIKATEGQCTHKSPGINFEFLLTLNITAIYVFMYTGVHERTAPGVTF